jgi:hypothetical protein
MGRRSLALGAFGLSGFEFSIFGIAYVTCLTGLRRDGSELADCVGEVPCSLHLQDPTAFAFRGLHVMFEPAFASCISSLHQIGSLRRRLDWTFTAGIPDIHRLRLEHPTLHALPNPTQPSPPHSQLHLTSSRHVMVILNSALLAQHRLTHTSPEKKYMHIGVTTRAPARSTGPHGRTLVSVWLEETQYSTRYSHP